MTLSPAMLRLLDAIARAMARADQHSIAQEATFIEATVEPGTPPKTFHGKAMASPPAAEGPGSGPPES